MFPASAVLADAPRLQDREFAQFRDFIHQAAGINLSDAKKPLVVSRLTRRLKHHGLESFGDYFQLLQRDGAERQMAVDLLTTNETYFFREPKHFDFLREEILPSLRGRSGLRIWSGACSSGAEPYTIAMVLADTLGHHNWEIVASDISTRVLETARAGHYPQDLLRGIPREMLRKFCLKGTGPQEGTFLITRALRERVRFAHINLTAPLPQLGSFDVIFLRNVMIYFDAATKRQVVGRMLPQLKPGGYFLVSQSESLNGVTEALTLVRPSIYRKPDA